MKQERHYTERLNYSAQERLAGLFVLGALAIIVMLLLLGSQNMKLLQGRVQFTALMRNPVGVSTETRVRISGIEAGTVRHITLMPDNRFKIVLSIYKEYETLVRADSRASISKQALIGDSVIEISPGSPELPPLAAGNAIEVQETMALDDMLAAVRPLLDKVNFSIDRIAAILSAVPEDSIRSTLQDTAAVASRLRQGGGAAGSLLYDEGMKNDLVASLRALQETLGITSEIARDSRNMIEQLRETADILHRQMQEIPEMTMKTQDLIDRTRNTVDAISRTWPVSTKMPVHEATEEPEVMANND
ncbi:MAG TPA: MlaD family protein [Gammaproteobacteria bacterium]|nr:MlaD family protein [Gammaproteobacteria bacterium]